VRSVDNYPNGARRNQVSQDPNAPSRAQRIRVRVATTLAAWAVAYLIVLALLVFAGHKLESLPPALNALVFTGVLVPLMGNLVMPMLNVAITRRVIDRHQTHEPERTHNQNPQAGAVAQATSGPPRPVMVSSIELRPVGRVESSLTDPATGPKQGDEGSPDAWLVFDQDVSQGLHNLERGAEIIVLTWLHRARRDVLRVHPRDLANPKQGVFSTRSPDRPNPIGLHRVQIASIEGTKIHVRNLEALDGTPILDVKPVLDRGLDG